MNNKELVKQNPDDTPLNNYQGPLEILHIDTTAIERIAKTIVTLCNALHAPQQNIIFHSMMRFILQIYDPKHPLDFWMKGTRRKLIAIMFFAQPCFLQNFFPLSLFQFQELCNVKEQQKLFPLAKNLTALYNQYYPSLTVDENAFLDFIKRQFIENYTEINPNMTILSPTTMRYIYLVLKQDVAYPNNYANLIRYVERLTPNSPFGRFVTALNQRLDSKSAPYAYPHQIYIAEKVMWYLVCNHTIFLSPEVLKSFRIVQFPEAFDRLSIAEQFLLTQSSLCQQVLDYLKTNNILSADCVRRLAECFMPHPESSPDFLKIREFFKVRLIYDCLKTLRPTGKGFIVSHCLKKLHLERFLSCVYHSKTHPQYQHFSTQFHQLHPQISQEMALLAT
jgi:hypothetical protein